MNHRYDTLLNAAARKMTRGCGLCAYPVFIDEYAYFSATIGSRAQQTEFAALTRDHVARAGPP